MASSEGADCQKQLRVLRVCKNVASYVGNTLFALQFPLRQASGRERLREELLAGVAI